MELAAVGWEQVVGLELAGDRLELAAAGLEAADRLELAAAGLELAAVGWEQVAGLELAAGRLELAAVGWELGIGTPSVELQQVGSKPALLFAFPELCPQVLIPSDQLDLGRFDLDELALWLLIHVKVVAMNRSSVVFL